MKPLCLALCLSLSAAAATHAVIFERIIAKVNGEIVTLSDLENRQLAAVQAAGVPSEQVPAFLREHGGRILQDTIDEMLVYQKGEQMGIAERVTTEYLDKVIQDIQKENKIENPEVFRAQLAREGLTLEGLRRNIKRSMVRQQVVRQQVESKVAITEDELKSEYTRKKSDYTKPTSVRLQEIVLKADDGAEAKAQAQELVRRAREGEDFGGLAKQYSTSATRTTGGDLGQVALGELHSELRKSITGVAVGGVTEAIALGSTLRILKVNERQEAHTVPYEQAREEISRQLRKDRGEREFARLVEELRKDAVIDVRVREAPVSADVTVPSAPALLRDPAVTGADALLPGGADSDEVVVSPQASPERVAPPDPPPAGTPTPLPGQPRGR